MKAIKSRKQQVRNVNYLKKGLISVILLIFGLLLTSSFRKENNRLYINNQILNKYRFCVEIREMPSYRIGPIVRLSSEGLFLYYKENDLNDKGCKYFFIDFSKLNYSKTEELYDFIIRNNLLNFTMSKGYVFEDYPTKITIIDRNKLNTIYYDGACYNEKLDSLIGYMNSFIPKKQLKNFKIKTHEKGIGLKCL